jgi:hypothetical protein
MSRKPQASLVARAHRQPCGRFSAVVHTARGVTRATSSELFATAFEALAWARAEIAGDHRPKPEAKPVVPVMTWALNFFRTIVARRIIRSCERALCRVLPTGERVDLLADNSRWSIATCRALAN